MNKLKHFWSNLQSSFWFVPSLIVLVSIAFALALIEADSAGSHRKPGKTKAMSTFFASVAERALLYILKPAQPEASLNQE